MDQRIDTATSIEIERLLTEFSWRVDRCGGEGVADLFTEDAVLEIAGFGDHPEQRFEGREMIATRWAGRPDDLITRHVVANVRVVRDGDGFAVSSLSLGYRYQGDGLGDTTPLVLSDFDDRIVRRDDGQLRFLQRLVRPVFVARELTA